MGSSKMPSRKRVKSVAFSIHFVNMDVLRKEVEDMAQPMKVGKHCNLLNGKDLQAIYKSNSLQKLLSHGKKEQIRNNSDNDIDDLAWSQLVTTGNIELLLATNIYLVIWLRTWVVNCASGLLVTPGQRWSHLITNIHTI